MRRRKTMSDMLQQVIIGLSIVGTACIILAVLISLAIYFLQ